MIAAKNHQGLISSFESRYAPRTDRYMYPLLLKHLRELYNEINCPISRNRNLQGGCAMKLILKSGVLLGILLFLAVSGSTAVKQTEKESDKTLSPYFLVKSDDASTDQLPLKSTSTDVNISGVIADVKVTQVYKNEGKRPIEAIYVFPASTKAAVYGMKMTIGQRTIVAKINKREEARKQYEEAKQQGKSASLLEQQRPNVFQMNVANIMPGDLIKVELSYTELITPENKVYEFVYPTVTGPRYSNQPAATADPKEKWVENPYTHQGEAPLYTFNISVNLNTGLPVRDVKCDSHKVNVAYDGPTTAFVKLDSSEAAGGNRDFILKYRLDGDKIDSGLLLYKGEKENFFLLMMQPPRKLETKNIPGREYVFIVDVSGSMYGFPLELSKKLLKDLIGNLRPTDMFNVLLFSGGSKLMSERSVPATAENIEQALNVIDKQKGGGGTELLPALKRALAIPRIKGYSRSVIIATDGYVTVEPEVFDLIRKNLGDANMFTFGIGSSVNRHLLEGMARVGMGEPFVIAKESEAAEKAERFRSLVQNPALTNIKINFGKFDVYDVEPISVPDIMADRPVIVFGKWRGAPKGTITLKGITGKGAHKETINVGKVKPADTNTALRYLWARHKITLLSDYIGRQSDKKRIDEVTQLGLDYNLLTAYTSFVAIDSEIRNKTGDSATIKQPLPLPQGVSDYAVGTGYMPSPYAMSPSVRYKASKGIASSRGGYVPEDAAEATADIKKDESRKQTPAFVEKVDASDKTLIVAITKMVNDRAADLKKCNTANLHGKMIVKVVISADGKVKSAIVKTDRVNNAGLGKRISSAIKKWQFAGLNASGDITVTITLNF
jgi:Ca-activated chloride channel homolog